MFANLFRRAEASVDSALGDLGNRVIIAVPFLIAIGFAASSLSITLDRLYGPETGNLMVAGAFCLVGLIAALIFRPRPRAKLADEALDASLKDAKADPDAEASIFDDETLMAVLTSAVPIIIPSAIRMGLKNWPLLVAIAAGLYMFTRTDQPDVTADVDATAPSI